ncbi:MAG TPA: HU family DNA-binding protein, partial [Sulfuricurvum sp.]|nr:HU family DNA-binding protein [Sulfuricurvum sp.]
ASLQKGKSGTVPGTTKKYTTSDKMVPKFKPGKSLKDSVAAAK